MIAERAVAIRAALHTAEIESSGDKVAEIAVHIGARVMDQAGEARCSLAGLPRPRAA